MNSVVQEGVRAAAARLEDTYGPDLPTQVEAELHRGPDAAPDQYFDPISIAALILGIAQLAWTVYHDLRKSNQSEPDPQVVTRTVRIQLDHPSNLGPQERAHVIEVTVEEVLRRTEESG